MAIKTQSQNRHELDANIRYRRKIVAKLDKNYHLISRIIELQLKEMYTVNIRVNYLQASFYNKNRENIVKKEVLEKKIKYKYKYIFDILSL